MTDQVTAPPDQTQQGMARALDKSVSNISRPLNKLIEQGLVMVDLRHVMGEARRRRVYWLDVDGITAAREIQVELEQREVEVQTLEGELMRCRLGEVNRLLGVNLPLPSLLSLASSGRPMPNRRPAMEESRFLPDLPDHFVGRHGPLGLLQDWVQKKGGGVQGIVGIAGMGKSTLARNLFEQIRFSRPSLWFTLTRWDTPETFLEPLARLLVQMGRPGLSSLLEQLGQGTSGRNQFGRYIETLTHDLRGEPGPFIVLDDLHLAQPLLATFLTDLVQYTSSRGKGPHWLLVSRTGSVLDPLIGKTPLGTLSLNGLERSELGELLPDLRADQVEAIHAATGGHPLGSRLIHPSNIQGPQDLNQFVTHQVLGDLGEGERALCNIATLSFGPTPEPDLVLDSAHLGDLETLVGKGLMVRGSDGTLALHEMLELPLRREMDTSTSTRTHQQLLKHHRRRDDDEALLRRLHHAIGAAVPKEALKLLKNWGEGLVERGRTELISMLDPLGDQLSGIDLVVPQMWKARIHLLWGDPKAARLALKQVEDQVGKKAPKWIELQWLLTQSRLLEARGDGEAAAQMRRQIGSMERSGDSWASGEAHNELGLHAQMQGDGDRARHHYRSALKVFEKLEHRGDAPMRAPGSVKVLANLAMLQRDEGQVEAALDTLLDASDRADEQGDDSSQARVLFYLGQIYWQYPDLEDPDRQLTAPALFADARKLFSEGGDRLSLVHVLLAIAEMQLVAMDYAGVRQSCDEAQHLAEQINSSPLLGQIQQIRAQLV